MLTTEQINRKTIRNNDYIRTIQNKTALYTADLDQVKREASQVCRVCYYFKADRIVMHAFTDWNCINCGKSGRHHNSGVPNVCSSCANDLDICRECGASMDEKKRESKSKSK